MKAALYARVKLLVGDVAMGTNIFTHLHPAAFSMNIQSR